MKQIKLTRVEPTGSQEALFGPSVPVFPPHTRAKGDALRTERQDLRLSPHEAGRRLGVDKRAIEEMERGEHDFDLRLAKAMIARHS